jgi:general secretion pathway protein D
VTHRLLQFGAAGVMLVLMAGCATGRAVRAGDKAVQRGDWDAAVAYYREALGRDPSRIDAKIALQRAMGSASAEHIKRARELEAQDQLAGAIAEYRLAAELDPTNTLAATKAGELERRQRDRVEAARPPSRIDTLREQARQSATIPTLDPRVKVPALRFAGAAIRDILGSIGSFSNPPINITYAQSAETSVGRPYSIDVQDLSLEEAFSQVLSNNNLAFKVVNPRTIMVFQDTAAEHQKYDDLYTQVFYLSNVEPADMQQVILSTTTTNNAALRPVCSQIKSTTALTCRATGPIINLIDRLVKANDKPKAEVLIEVEVLEVDRSRAKQLGLDLNQYALGFTLSPEVAPPNTSGSFPPATPPPFNLNTISQGVSTNDFYMTVPTALIRLLESDSHTRTLAKPSVRGAEGSQITMNLGDQIPTLNSQIPSTNTGIGFTTAPVTSFTYKNIGVNLTMTPKVTFDDEIILNPLTIENSAVGPFVQVGETSVQSFSDRIVTTALRLRDGESNLMAGLLRERTDSTSTGLVGLARLPILRNIFGNTNDRSEQSDIVVVITPHIVRSHELTAEDLRPMYIGTQQNLGQAGTPPLISPETPLPAGVTPPGVGNQPPAPAAGGAAPAAPGAVSPPQNPPDAPVAVPIVPAGPGDQPPAVAPAPPPLIALFSPGTEFRSGSMAPYTIPITVTNLPEVGTLTLRVTYNPAVLRAQAATQGTFMSQGNVSPTFVPRIDPDAGTVDLVFSRPSGSSGASGSGLLGSIQFVANSPGAAQIAITGTASAPSGQPVAVQFGSTTVVVR